MGNGPCFVSFEPNLVSLRRDLIASIRDTVENAIEYTRFCFEYRTIFDFRTKETRNDREREREKDGERKKLTDHCQGEKTGRRLYDTLHGLRREACTVQSREEKERNETVRAVETTSSRLTVWKRKRKRAEPARL